MDWRIICRIILNGKLPDLQVVKGLVGWKLMIGKVGKHRLYPYI